MTYDTTSFKLDLDSVKVNWGSKVIQLPRQTHKHTHTRTV